MFTPSSLNFTVLSEGFETSCPLVGPNNAPSLACLQDLANRASVQASQLDMAMNDPIDNVSTGNNKIAKLNSNIQYLRENPDYKYTGDGKSDLPNNDKPATMLSTYLQDNQEIIVQQNAMYILGTITTSTLLIFALVMSMSSSD